MISQILRRLPIGKMFLDYFPSNVIYLDGKKRLVTREILREFKLWKSSCSIEMNMVYESYNGGDFLDIGSFHGFYSHILAPKAKEGDTFWSFEPDKNAYKSLLHNISVASDIFPLVNFSILPFPISTSSEVTMEFPDLRFKHPKFGSSLANSKGVVFKAINLDKLVEAVNIQPSFIKIDVEGAEYDVLKSLEKTLIKFQPTIMLETHPNWLPEGINVKMIKFLLSEIGYTSKIISDDTISIREIFFIQ